MASYHETLHRNERETVPFRRGAFGRVMLALKACVTLGALALLVRLVDTHVLLARLKSIPGTVLVVAVALLAVQIGLVALRWRVIVTALPRPARELPSLSRFVQMTFAAVLLGQVLPSVAGDGLRVILVRDAGVPLRSSVESTLFDRAIALLTLLVLALPAMAVSPLLVQTGIALPATALIAAALAGAALVLAAAGPLRRLDWRPATAVAETLIHLRCLLRDRTHGTQAIVLSAAVHVLSLLVFVLLARGLGLPLGFRDACAIVPLILLIQMVPLAIGGWGLREGLVVTLLGAGGIGSAEALSLSLSFGTLMLVAALPGLASLMRATFAARLRPARA